ncbi:ABC transporter substrate-binding protein [Microbacterium faecale]|uniref:ABC transporter substrate-binding protein n=1 Tax=Microbacterium faecale TaxID=1804630 RepID=A0A916Y547_9MICO|nr:extracellular solute-binding protein [Microbacterium faecale]GGD31585.1 ABC transporter substrate-binding protein [Microbacterium faecale]
MIRTRTQVSLAAVLASAVVLTGCAGEDPAPSSAPGPSNSEVDALYEAALEEGSVTWYSSAPNEAPAAFEEAYPGITVDFVRLPAGQLGTRYAQERDAGAAPGDVVTIADEQFINDARDEGWIDTDLSNIPAMAEWPEDAVDDGVVTLGRAAYGIVYNTDLLSDPPATWEDVLDPRFEGVIQNGDPGVVPGYLALMHVLREEYGDEYLTEVAAMGTTYEASQVSVTQALGAGAATLGMTGSFQLTEMLAQEGAPVKFQDMSPTTGSTFYTIASTDSTHPNAAKLLLNFLTSAEGQTAFAADISSPLGVDAVPTSVPLPDGWQDYSVDEVEAAKSEILALLELQ